MNDSSAVHSMYDDVAAKSREVSPKLVVRGKKYGRRSRPQSVAPFESSQSDSEEDYDFARVPNVATEKSPKTYHKVSYALHAHKQLNMKRGAAHIQEEEEEISAFVHRSSDRCHKVICMIRMADVFEPPQLHARLQTMVQN